MCKGFGSLATTVLGKYYRTEFVATGPLHMCIDVVTVQMSLSTYPLVV